MRLFHGTSVEFDAFDLNFAVSGGKADNGYLGVWLAVDAELAARFGTFTLVVDAPFVCIYSMGVSELMKMHMNPDCWADSRGFYGEARERLIAAGYDSIAVTEVDGSVGMYIALHPDRLVIVDRAFNLEDAPCAGGP